MSEPMNDVELWQDSTAAIAAAKERLDEDGCAALEYPLAKRLLKALRVSMYELQLMRADMADLRRQVASLAEAAAQRECRCMQTETAEEYVPCTGGRCTL